MPRVVRGVVYAAKRKIATWQFLGRIPHNTLLYHTSLFSRMNIDYKEYLLVTIGGHQLNFL